MIAPLQHGDVTQLQLSTWKSRVAGMAVSAFVCDGVLIDTGFPDVAAELGRWVDAHPVRGAIVTHAHEDHSAGVAELAKRGIGVQCSALTDAWMRRDEEIGYYRQFCWGLRQRLLVPTQSFASDRFELRAAVGHSADHHVVWDAQTGTVFCGDLFIGVKLRIAHYDEDVRRQVRTLREVASWKPARIFDAHRGLLPDGVAALVAKADWLEQTIAEIETLARDGMNELQIRQQVLGREDATGWVSFGEYSRINFVRSVLRSATGTDEATTGQASA